mgnify:CR=1 FL=1
MDPGVDDVYDDAKAAIVEGYLKADEAVSSFASDMGISSEEAWGLIADEASLRGDEAMEFLAEHPIAETPIPWAPVVMKALGWGLERWSQRRK